MITIAIVEDDKNYRIKLKQQFKKNSDFKVFSFSNSRSFFANKIFQNVDILYLDLNLPDIGGLDLISIVLEKNPNCKIIILSILQGDDVIFKALQRGAVGYILKTELSDIINITNDVYFGGSIISPTIAFRIINFFKKLPEKKPLDLLSNQENKILKLIIDGLNTKEISEFLLTTEGTVRNQIKSIYKKMQVNSRIQLILKVQKSK
jgi:DNA-binding NarL/FixJ family response regulator